MNKRGVVLLLVSIVVIVLSILAAVFFKRSISENNLVRRQVDYTQALWSAEEGLAQAIAILPAAAGTYVDPVNVPPRYTYTISGPTGSVYQIESTGTVIGARYTINRAIEAYVRLDQFQAGQFLNAIEVNGLLNLLGATDIKPDDHPDDWYWEENAGITFFGRFGINVDDLRGLAQYLGTYYEDPSPASGIEHNLNNVVTWIKITNPADQLKLPKENWVGSGILVVEGDTDIAGGTFNGIVWIRGALMITGNFINNGTVICESGATVTKIAGTPVLTWDPVAIANALAGVGNMSPRRILSWREIP